MCVVGACLNAARLGALLVPETLARLGNRAGLLTALARSRKRSRTSECCRRGCAKG